MAAALKEVPRLMFNFLPSLFVSNAVAMAPEEAMAHYIVNKNKKALNVLYQAYADDLYHYLVSLSDATLAKDIAQKTWLKVIEHPHNYHRAGSVKAWLFTIARNALFDEFRKHNRLVALDGSEVLKVEYENDNHRDNDHSDNSRVEAQISTQELNKAFNCALNALPFEQRETFCLQQEGFSVIDIASMTNSKQETVKTRLRYAKTKLKQMLEQVDE